MISSPVMVDAFDKVDCFVHCNRTLVLAKIFSKIRNFQMSSTSPPGVNLVDGLPPAASKMADTFYFNSH